LLEAKKNIERRKTNLQKVSTKIEGLLDGKTQTESKLERLGDEFTNLNKTFDSSFH
jgi:predicted nuclease with TOPRIM domain